MRELTANFFEQSKPWARNGLFLLLVVIGIWQCLAWLSKPTTMPIKHVRVGGELNHVAREEISASLSQLVDTGYFAMDTGEILKQVTGIEWVNKARLRRVWPDTIVLLIEEQQPVAVWNETALLNINGEVFRPEFDKALMALPSLTGIDTNSQKVLAELKKIEQSLKGLDVSVKTLNLAEHGSWSALMSNGTKIKVGDQLPEQKMTKSLKLLASLEGNLIEHLDEIDLRYPNGMAVKWANGYKFSELKAAVTLKKDQPIKG